MGHFNLGRLAVFAGANVAALVSAVFVIAALGDHVVTSQRQEIAAAMRHLAVERALARRNAAALTLDPTRLEEMTSRFIQGETASIQAANLLALLKLVGDRHAVTFTSVSILPNVDWQGRTLIGARVEFTANNDRVASVVRAIEQGHEPLFIPRANLRATGEHLSQGDEIAANLDVYGLARWSGG
jgi:hypothetical protein